MHVGVALHSGEALGARALGGHRYGRPGVAVGRPVDAELEVGVRDRDRPVLRGLTFAVLDVVGEVLDRQAARLVVADHDHQGPRSALGEIERHGHGPVQRLPRT